MSIILPIYLSFNYLIDQLTESIFMTAEDDDLPIVGG